MIFKIKRVADRGIEKKRKWEEEDEKEEEERGGWRQTHKYKDRYRNRNSEYAIKSWGHQSTVYKVPQVRFTQDNRAVSLCV